MKIGRFVKCFLKNNLIVEGKVESWNDKEILLSLEDSEILIFNPLENLLMVKFISKNNKNEPVENDIISNNVSQTQSLPIKNPFDPDYTKNIAELKQELDKQEKEIIKNKLKSFAIEEVKKVKYEYPGFFKK